MPLVTTDSWDPQTSKMRTETAETFSQQPQKRDNQDMMIMGVGGHAVNHDQHPNDISIKQSLIPLVRFDNKMVEIIIPSSPTTVLPRPVLRRQIPIRPMVDSSVPAQGFWSLLPLLPMFELTLSWWWEIVWRYFCSRLWYLSNHFFIKEEIVKDCINNLDTTTTMISGTHWTKLLSWLVQQTHRETLVLCYVCRPAYLYIYLSISYFSATFTLIAVVVPARRRHFKTVECRTIWIVKRCWMFSARKGCCESSCPIGFNKDAHRMYWPACFFEKSVLSLWAT